MDGLKDRIRDIPDFPKKGVLFKDITTLLKDPRGFHRAIDALAERIGDREIDVIAGAEARGFIIGGALAYALNKGFVPVRKPGKLPAPVISHNYQLEYGTDSLEMHRDAVTAGRKVLVVDDLLATGGTIEAVCNMVERLNGAVVGVAFLIELSFLGGRRKLMSYDVQSIITYGDE